MLSFDKPWDWLIIAVLVIILFGYKKLPDAARSVGRSLRIFKTEIKGMTEDDKARQANQAPEPPKALPPAEVIRRDVQPARAAGERPRPSPRPNP